MRRENLVCLETGDTGPIQIAWFYLNRLTQTAPTLYPQTKTLESDALPYKARSGPGTQPWQSRPAESLTHICTSLRDRGLTASV